MKKTSAGATVLALATGSVLASAGPASAGGIDTSKCPDFGAGNWKTHSIQLNVNTSVRGHTSGCFLYALNGTNSTSLRRWFVLGDYETVTIPLAGANDWSVKAS